MLNNDEFYSEINESHYKTILQKTKKQQKTTQQHTNGIRSSITEKGKQFLQLTQSPQIG